MATIRNREWTTQLFFRSYFSRAFHKHQERQNRTICSRDMANWANIRIYTVNFWWFWSHFRCSVFWCFYNQSIPFCVKIVKVSISMRKCSDCLCKSGQLSNIVYITLWKNCDSPRVDWIVWSAWHSTDQNLLCTVNMVNILSNKRSPRISTEFSEWR